MAQRIAATGRCVLLDVHSYSRDPLPYELHSAAASGAGGRANPRPPDRRVSALMIEMRRDADAAAVTRV